MSDVSKGWRDSEPDCQTVNIETLDENKECEVSHNNTLDECFLYSKLTSPE